MGRVAYILLLPFLRQYLKGTQRGYVLLINEDKVLMLKNWLGDGKWALPGGGTKHDESPQEAAIREAREEVGIELKAGDLKLLSQGVWRSNNFNHHYSIYTAQATDKRFKVDGLEVVLAKWLNIQQLKPGDADSEILDALSKIAKG